MADGDVARVAQPQLLREVVALAGQAPSILNTQPWRWRVHETRLELFADHSRQVTSIDPDGRLLTVSCGAALHHARVALASAGHHAVVVRTPDPDQPDLLARIHVAGRRAVSWRDTAMRRSIRTRRSDRRPFAAIGPVPPETVAALRRAADVEQVRLHHVEPAYVGRLRDAVRLAQRHQAQDEAYVDELRSWVRRLRADGEGLPADTFVKPLTEVPVPLRDFSLDGEILQHPGLGDDRYAEYLIISTGGDDHVDWLRAGEATSAVWLTAVHHDLAVSVLSEAVEVPDARELLRRLLPWPEHPQLVLRAGIDMQAVPPKKTPRRPPEEIIDSGA